MSKLNPPKVDFTQPLYIKRVIPQYFQKSYAYHWKLFTTFCSQRSVAALPTTENTLMKYVKCISASPQMPYPEKTIKESLEHYLTPIELAHIMHEYPSPGNSSRFQQFIKRQIEAHEYGYNRVALKVDDVVSMIRNMPINLIGTRNAAIMSLGYMHGLSSDILAGIKFDQIDVKRNTINIKIPHRPVLIVNDRRYLFTFSHLKSWIFRSGLSRGALFPSMKRYGALEYGYANASEYFQGKMSNAGMLKLILKCCVNGGFVVRQMPTEPLCTDYPVKYACVYARQGRGG